MFAGWRCAVEIADQADSDAFLVCPVAGCAAGVCAGELSSPAVRRLDLAVAAVSAVADYEIVTDAVPAIIFPVPFIDYGRVALIGGGMMNYYRRPGPFRTRRRPAIWDRTRRWQCNSRLWRRRYRRRLWRRRGWVIVNYSSRRNISGAAGQSENCQKQQYCSAHIITLLTPFFQDLR